MHEPHSSGVVRITHFVCDNNVVMGIIHACRSTFSNTTSSESIDRNTVEPALSGTALSSLQLPLLDLHLAKSQKFQNINTIKMTCIEWSPLLSNNNHLSSPKLIFHCLETVLIYFGNMSKSLSFVYLIT